MDVSCLVARKKGSWGHASWSWHLFTFSRTLWTCAPWLAHPVQVLDWWWCCYVFLCRLLKISSSGRWLRGCRCRCSVRFCVFLSSHRLRKDRKKVAPGLYREQEDTPGKARGGGRGNTHSAPAFRSALFALLLCTVRRAGLAAASPDEGSGSTRLERYLYDRCHRGGTILPPFDVTACRLDVHCLLRGYCGIPDPRCPYFSHMYGPQVNAAWCNAITTLTLAFV